MAELVIGRQHFIGRRFGAEGREFQSLTVYIHTDKS